MDKYQSKEQIEEGMKFAVTFNRLFALVHFGEGNTPEFSLMRKEESAMKNLCISLW